MGEVSSLGISALVNIFISLICIVFSWWVLVHIRLEGLVRARNPIYIHILVILLAIVIGHGVAGFFIQYLDWSRMVTQLLV